MLTFTVISEDSYYQLQININIRNSNRFFDLVTAIFALQIHNILSPY